MRVSFKRLVQTIYILNKTVSILVFTLLICLKTQMKKKEREPREGVIAYILRGHV